MLSKLKGAGHCTSAKASGEKQASLSKNPPLES